MYKYTNIAVANRQTIEDLAVQYYGAMEGVEHLLNDNRALLPDGFDTQLPQGTILRIREGEPAEVKTLAEITRLGVQPATGDRPTDIPDGPDHNEDHNEDHDI